MMDCKLLHIGVPNKNNRIYPIETVEAIIEQAKTRGPILGQVGLPDDVLKVSMSNVSHMVENLRIEGEYLVGNIKVLDTPAGKVLAPILSNYEFRPCGTGIVSADGIVSDYKLTSIDALEDAA